MNKTTRRLFWTAWALLLLLLTATCLSLPANGDTAALTAAYFLSLSATMLCYRSNPRTAIGNLIAMLLYNIALSYCLIFESSGGAGLTWWFYALTFNALHAISLLAWSAIRSLRQK